MIQGMKDYFHEEPEAGIQQITFAVPEPDRCAACQREIDQMWSAEGLSESGGSERPRRRKEVDIWNASSALSPSRSSAPLPKNSLVPSVIADVDGRAPPTRSHVPSHRGSSRLRAARARAAHRCLEAS